MTLTNLNRWDIVLYLKSWKEGKRVSHAHRVVPYDERRVRVRVREEITAPLLLYRVNVLPFLRIESTQLKWCIKYRRY
jgi:hypothetical protein